MPFLAALAPLVAFALAGVAGMAQAEDRQLPEPRSAEPRSELPESVLRAERQTGGPVGKFNDWMRRNGLSLSAAAESLGMTRRMIAHYKTGSRPIPKTVLLALKGWEAEQAELRGQRSR